jgi:ABC-type branched-subunit amino acid transport system ATPase component
VAIFGRHGAGVTTLLKCCVGDVAGMMGGISYHDASIHPVRCSQYAPGIGFVPQGHNVFEPEWRKNPTIAGWSTEECARKRIACSRSPPSAAHKSPVRYQVASGKFWRLEWP